ncbi:hypothetical protein A9G40_05260 [Gilliamella sp. Nev3-1]|nr:hypothetical protein A9G40_05260 [Gilliamella apicola]
MQWKCLKQKGNAKDKTFCCNIKVEIKRLTNNNMPDARCPMPDARCPIIFYHNFFIHHTYPLKFVFIKQMVNVIFSNFSIK